MISYRGRQVDPVALWGDYVEFPPNWSPGGEEFSPLVKCPNPEHDTMKRHFQVNLHQDTVHCFAHCGISGSYEHAIAMIEGVTHRQARRSILKHSRVGGGNRPAPGARSRKRRPAKAISADSLTYDRYIPQTGMEYLRGRGISSESVSKWELGWDSDDLRVVIPAKDSRGRARFLIRRAVKPRDHPKYLYPEGSDRNRLLFGACHIDPGMVRSRGIILVEGSIDCILQHQDGYTNTGGILGSYLSEIQARYIASLRPARVITMFDADGAGVEATISVSRQLPMIPHLVCRYPRGKTDPAELSKEERDRVVSRAISFNRWRRLIHETPKRTTRRKENSFG